MTSPSVNSGSGVSATFVYDADGELVDTTDADGRRTTYSYDQLGDQTGETWVGASPSEKITYTYDSDKEMTGAADSFATLTFTYLCSGQPQVDDFFGGKPWRVSPRVELGVHRAA